MKITCTLPKGAGDILKRYAAYKLEGDTVEETASYLLLRAVDDIFRSKGFNHLLQLPK